MCNFCDEKGLPCLLCGAATMRHQFDRGRCGYCASANRPPREWPVFRFCPYCGRELKELHSEESEKEKQEEQEMRTNHKWTCAEEKLLVDSIREGCSRADICDRLGLSESVVYNQYRKMREDDKTLPLFPRGERVKPVSKSEAAGEDRPENGEAATAEACGLNLLEQEMADIIAENKETIETLRRELDVEREARAEDGRAYQKKIEQLSEENAAKDKTIAKVYGDLESAYKQRDKALENLELAISAAETPEDEWATPEEELASMQLDKEDLTNMVHARDELIVSMARAIFLGPKEVILA